MSKEYAPLLNYRNRYSRIFYDNGMGQTELQRLQLNQAREAERQRVAAKVAEAERQGQQQLQTHMPKAWQIPVNIFGPLALGFMGLVILGGLVMPWLKKD